MKPSPQQQAVIHHIRNGRKSIVLEAVAGSGKTTTLLMALSHMQGSVALAAYNTKIADELKYKISQQPDQGHVQCGTFHSFGMRTLRRTLPSDVVVDADKVRKMLESSVDVTRLEDDWIKAVSRLVSLAKQTVLCDVPGIGYAINDPDVWEHLIERHDILEDLKDGTEILLNRARVVRNLTSLARRSLVWSNAESSVIDFDDMIYLPLVRGLRMQQYDWVLVDEAQDTNVARRLMMQRMTRNGGRVLAVGDPHQAIYGFTGADANSLDLIREVTGAITLPLSVCYRCAPRIVDYVRQWVDHITAWDGHRELGLVADVTEEYFLSDPKLTVRPGDAILCRNTKPLVALAFTLWRHHIRCHVEGRDIGRGLMKLAQRWSSVKTVATLRTRLMAYRLKETERLKADGQLVKMQSVQDRVDTLITVMQNLPEDAHVSAVNPILTKLFADSTPETQAATVTLSTIHKAKGREWDRVLWYGRALLQPSPYAEQEWQKHQEVNLMYVAGTRAKSTLIEIHMQPKKPTDDPTDN